jgi:hypothetical protein
MTVTEMLPVNTSALCVVASHTYSRRAQLAAQRELGFDRRAFRMVPGARIAHYSQSTSELRWLHEILSEKVLATGAASS